jgi:acyl-CoA synthetase (AMP-forming)/AMP-acid ligase II
MNEELKRLSLMTMPQALKYRAETQGDRLALREKDFGVWRRTSWREYFEKARRFAIGLHALGFRAGDRLAVASDDTPGCNTSCATREPRSSCAVIRSRPTRCSMRSATKAACPT